MEKVSLGSPAIFQALIFIGSPSVFVKEKSCEHGILSALDFLTQSWQVLARKADVNAPRYAITPDEINTSPIRLSYCTWRLLAAWDHLYKTIASHIDY